MISEHEFTKKIRSILQEEFGSIAEEVFQKSELLQYLNIKTRSASRGSKSRGSFANHYALYVLVEDYIAKDFHGSGNYAAYEGAKFSDLFQRQRELPFGSKLQNHALNHRLNEEFRKYFPTCEYLPILRSTETNRYWINENLLKVPVADIAYQIAPAIARIIDAYVEVKRDSFESFIKDCERLENIQSNAPEEVRAFVHDLLRPSVDARIFEIVSYSILKPHYGRQLVYWGWNPDEIEEDALVLYKTGRTNANDGGIDFVMKPLGRFFQVTETTDVRKYFLDIDKIQRFPITFIVKSEDQISTLEAKIEKQARRVYGIDRVVEQYMACIEELINIPILLERFDNVIEMNELTNVVRELVVQGRLEFNMPLNNVALE